MERERRTAARTDFVFIQERLDSGIKKINIQLHNVLNAGINSMCFIS